MAFLQKSVSIAKRDVMPDCVNKSTWIPQKLALGLFVGNAFTENKFHHVYNTLGMVLLTPIAQ